MDHFGKHEKCYVNRTESHSVRNKELSRPSSTIFFRHPSKLDGLREYQASTAQGGKRGKYVLRSCLVIIKPILLRNWSKPLHHPLPTNRHSKFPHAIVLQCFCRFLFLSVASITKSSAPSKVTVTWIFLIPLPPRVS